MHRLMKEMGAMLAREAELVGGVAAGEWRVGGRVYSHSSADNAYGAAIREH
jgi:hypothetical protein